MMMMMIVYLRRPSVATHTCSPSGSPASCRTGAAPADQPASSSLITRAAPLLPAHAPVLQLQLQL